MSASDSIFDPKKHSASDLFGPDLGHPDLLWGGPDLGLDDAFRSSRSLLEKGTSALASASTSAATSSVDGPPSSTADSGGFHRVPDSTTIGRAGGLRINLEWDSSVASAPAGFMRAIETAAAFYTRMFTNNVVVNVAVGWNEFGGRAMDPGSVAESFNYGSAAFNYQQVRDALSADASHSQIQAAADANLPPSLQTTRAFWLPNAQQKALGLLDANANGLDGAMGLSSAYRFSFSQEEIGRGTYDAVGEAEHELSEIMGRVSYLRTTGDLTALDLFTYVAPGSRGNPGYFSIDNGTTNLGTFNDPAKSGGGDPFDWAPSVVGDSYGAFASTGIKEVVSSTDLAVDSVLGWNLSATGKQATSTLGLA